MEVFDVSGYIILREIFISWQVGKSQMKNASQKSFFRRIAINCYIQNQFQDYIVNEDSLPS